nr:hypothetical protein [Tanacetum cinerariifolium]
MDLFAFINHVDPTKVQIGKKQIKEGQVPLLKSTKGRVVSLVGVNEQGKQNDNVQDVDAHVVQDEGVNIVADEETWHPAERFVVSSDSSHHSSTNAVDDEVTSIVRSPVPPPPVMAAAIATTDIASVTSASVLGVRTEPSHRSLFRDSASPCTARVDITGPSQPAGVENMINDSALDDPEVCRSMVDHLAPSGIRGDVASRHLYLFVAMVLLIEPFSAENLVGEASTSGLQAAVAATTTLSTTFVQASSVPPIPASDHEVVDTEPQ